MTTTFDEASMIRAGRGAAPGVGSARTVCSVVTTGMVSRDSSARMWPPASPPKMPNSCCRDTTSNCPAFRKSAARAIVLHACRHGSAGGRRADSRRRWPWSVIATMAGLHIPARGRDRLLQIGREGGDAAAARQRIADERHAKLGARALAPVERGGASRRLPIIARLSGAVAKTRRARRFTPYRANPAFLFKILAHRP